jgi:hypothetical protein
LLDIIKNDDGFYFVAAGQQMTEGPFDTIEGMAAKNGRPLGRDCALRLVSEVRRDAAMRTRKTVVALMAQVERRTDGWHWRPYALSKDEFDGPYHSADEVAEVICKRLLRWQLDILK